MAESLINTLSRLPQNLASVLQKLPEHILFQMKHIEHLIKHLSWEAVVSQMHILANMIANINYSSLLQMIMDCNATAQVYMPTIRHVTFQIFDGIFAPKQLMKQLTLALMLQLGVSGVHWLSYFVNYSYLLMTNKGRQVLSANHRLNEAKTFKEWKATAEELDHLNGKTHCDHLISICFSGCTCIQLFLLLHITTIVVS
jgi:hypothetical protein